MQVEAQEQRWDSQEANTGAKHPCEHLKETGSNYRQLSQILHQNRANGFPSLATVFLPLVHLLFCCSWAHVLIQCFFLQKKTDSEPVKPQYQLAHFKTSISRMGTVYWELGFPKEKIREWQA